QALMLLTLPVAPDDSAGRRRGRDRLPSGVAHHRVQRDLSCLLVADAIRLPALGIHLTETHLLIRGRDAGRRLEQSELGLDSGHRLRVPATAADSTRDRGCDEREEPSAARTAIAARHPSAIS